MSRGMILFWGLISIVGLTTGGEAQSISTVAGSGWDGIHEGPGAVAQLNGPKGIFMDGSGNLYIADSNSHRIGKVDPSGIITTVAGSGGYGFSGDGEQATSASFKGPWGLAVDGSGNLYIADSNNHRIRKVDLSGTITTVAGNGMAGYSGDGGAAIQAQLNAPAGIFIDGLGNLYIADSENHRIRKVDTSGTISTVAGNKTWPSFFPGDGGPATRASLARPVGVFVDESGNIYIADRSNHRIRKVDTTGNISTVAGNGEMGYSGDGGEAISASLADPAGVFVDESGNIYLADTGNHRIRKVDTSGRISTVVGNGEMGYSGDGGEAISASLAEPVDVFVGAPGDIYIVDKLNGRVRKVDSSGIISTVAGGSGDGGQAIHASLDPIDVFVDGSGNIYVADGSGRVRKVDPSGIISTVAGNGIWGSGGDGGPATSAQLTQPVGMFLDGAGNIYIADRYNHRIRKVDISGTISTVAGNGERGFSGDGEVATSASLAWPVGVFMDESGDLYIVDMDNHRIRKVDTSGTISTVAGNGEAGFSGDGGAATSASLNNPQSVHVDGEGNFFIADGDNYRIRKVDTSGVITTVAGNGNQDYSGDGGPATEVGLAFARDVFVAGSGNIYIADAWSHRIRKVDTSGIISTVAGNGDREFSGDGGPATGASLRSPRGVFVDRWGDLYIADTDNRRIRKVEAAEEPADLIEDDRIELRVEDPDVPAAMDRNRSVSIDGSVDPGDGPEIVRMVWDWGDGTIGEGFFPGTHTYADFGTYAVTVTAFNDERGWQEATVTVHGEGPIITTVAGNGTEGFSGDGDLAVNTSLFNPQGVFVDRWGDLFIADTWNNRIRKVDTSGRISTIAGNGDLGFSGDGGPATSASLNGPTSVFVDGEGNIYFTDFSNVRVRKVDTAGIITTVAGNGDLGFSGDGGPATSASLHQINDLAVDGAGNIYIMDTVNGRIRKVDAAGIITTVAGNGDLGFSGDGGPATSASLRDARSVWVDESGNLYIADGGNHRIRKVDTSGIITTVAGSGMRGFSGDGGPAISARLAGVLRISMDREGNLYIAEEGNHRIRKVDTSGIIFTVAGNGTQGFSGDDGQATQASLNLPMDVSVDWAGDIYIADTDNHRIRKVAVAEEPADLIEDERIELRVEAPDVPAEMDRNRSVSIDGSVDPGDGPEIVRMVWDWGDGTIGEGFFPGIHTYADFGTYAVTVTAFNDERGWQEATVTVHGEEPIITITTVAGNGVAAFSGDGGLATRASLNGPTGVCVDGSGNVYIADAHNHRIRKVDTSGMISTVAGNGEWIFSGDGGLATSTSLALPTGLFVDGSDNIYIVDAGNNRIRKVDRAGMITTMAGSSNIPGFSGDGGPATSARLNISSPVGIFVNESGDIFFPDTGNDRIRKVDTSGMISTVAGGGESESFDAEIAATDVEINGPADVFGDRSGEIYIAQGAYIRKLDNSGMVSTVAGGGHWWPGIGVWGYSGDGEPAKKANFDGAIGVFVDRDNIYIADKNNHRIRWVTSSGMISTVVGNGKGGFSGDGGSAVLANLNGPVDVFADGAGDLYIADCANHRIRKVVFDRAPFLVPMGDRTVTEGDTLRVVLSATDPDGDSIVFSMSGNPPGSRLVGDIFTWRPDLDQAGGYTLSFTADDGRWGTDSDTLTITVKDRVFASSISMDFDLAGGDQEQRILTDAVPDEIYELQLHVQDAPEITGWGVTIEYDQARVQYVSGSFHASDFIPGLRVLEEETEGRIEIAGVLLGLGAGKMGDGVLGTVRFEITKGFADSTDLVVSEISFLGTDGEVDEQTVRSVATIIGGFVPAALPGDFDDSGAVDFGDFFLFADAFGGSDPTYDLDGSGQVDFGDFFMFADAFGGPLGKLLELAEEMLVLPTDYKLSAPYPNPFNSKVVVKYSLPEEGEVDLVVHNELGQVVRRLVGGHQGMGHHRVMWDGRDEDGIRVATGMYIVRMQADGFSQVRKIALVK